MADAGLLPVAWAPAAPALRLAVRGGAAAAERIGRGFGVALPGAACRAAAADGKAALWLGPDEWLLLAPEGPAEPLLAAIAAELAGEPASLVDISHRQLGLAVSGPKAAETLNAFVPLDLDPAAFPAGMCTRTLLAKAEIVLWRTGPEAFHVEAWRSFIPYVTGLLAEAAREYGA